MSKPQSSAQEYSAGAAPPAQQPVFVQLPEDPKETSDNTTCALWIVFFVCCFPLSLCAIPCYLSDQKKRDAAAQARRAERAHQLNSVVYTQPGAASAPAPYAPAHLPPPQRAMDPDLEKGPRGA